MAGRLRRLGLAAITILVVGCAGPTSTNSQDVTPRQDPQGTTAPGGSTSLGLVAIDMTQQAADAGYQQVTIHLGVNNSGDRLDWIGLVAMAGGLYWRGQGPNLGQANLNVTEGRAYPYKNCVFCDLTPLPPGLTICGNSSGPFHLTFDQIPATAHPSVLDIPPLQADLSKPLGSCPTFDASSLPTSFAGKSATPGDPGFSVQVKGGSLQKNSNADPNLGPWFDYGISATVTNNAPLDPLEIGLTFDSGQRGVGIWALTDKGYITWVGNKGGDTSCTWDVPSPGPGGVYNVAPGQTERWDLCFPTTLFTSMNFGNPVVLGSPIALLTVDSSGAFGLERLTP
jgi:hypothetical protein